MDEDKALKQMTEGLKSENRAYIYHCYHHSMCPIGFEKTPVNATDAYQLTKHIRDFETWIIIGEISKCYNSFHTKKWKDIVTGINL